MLSDSALQRLHIVNDDAANYLEQTVMKHSRNEMKKQYFSIFMNNRKYFK